MQAVVGQWVRPVTVLAVSIAMLVGSSGTLAGTIVRVDTTVGNFSLELFDDESPVTVQNFLNYVNRNDYNGTYLHRVVDNFVMQGGGYRFQPFVGPIDVPSDPPIQNEFNRSNLRGTLAMAKLDGDENSATSQWYVNISDNVSLDTTNGGFAVFGQVLGNGMETVDAIDALPIISLGAKAPSTPYASPVYEDPTDFVFLNMEVVDRFSSAPHVFESGSGKLITSINVDGGADLINMNFSLVPTESGVVVQANLESVIARNEFEGMATYSSQDTRLRIPQLEVNIDGIVSVVNNVVFALSSNSPIQFTLESFDQ